MEIDEINNTITITSIPLQITIDAIIKNIVELREKKMFEEITDIKDYTKNETGVKTIIYLKPDANPYKTVENLYKKNTGLKKTYPVGLKMIDDYKDYDYGVKSFLLEWIEFRRDTVRSSYNFKLVKAMESQNINDIMIFVSNKDNAKKTINIATTSKNKKEYAERLVKEYTINSQQANTIANMPTTAFTIDAHDSYLEKKKALKEEIKLLEKVLDDDQEIDKVIIEQLEEGIKLFGCKRKSKIVKDDEEEEIPDTNHIIGISKDGYIKKVPIEKRQIGQVGNTHNKYMVNSVNNRDNILVFDSTGKVSRIAVSSIPDMKLKDEGILLERFFEVKGDIVSVLIEPDEKELKKYKKDLFLVFLTKLGFVKKTLLTEFTNVNGSTTAIKLPNTDELVAVEFASDDTIKDMIIYTNLGNGIRRDINEFSTMKAQARGVRQITVTEDEYCVGFDKVDPTKNYMFYITSAGRMKLTEMKYLPAMKRKDDVISLIKLENRESLVGVHSVNITDSVVVYKKNSEPETLELRDVPVLTRISKAEKLVKTPKGDVVLSFRIQSKE